VSKRSQKSRIVSGKLRLKKIHCSKGGTNGTKNYPNQSYYESTEVIHGDGIKALMVQHRTGSTTPVEKAEGPGPELADGRNPEKQSAI
jgi:hypothetical protein